MFGIAKLCPMADWLGKAVFTPDSGRHAKGTRKSVAPFPSQGLADWVKSANMLKIWWEMEIESRRCQPLDRPKASRTLALRLGRGMACRVPARCRHSGIEGAAEMPPK